jgi:hypothetical protein
MNRTGKRLILTFGVVAIVAGIFILIGLMVTYAPRLIIPLCVGLLLAIMWKMTGDLIE